MWYKTHAAVGAAAALSYLQYSPTVTPKEGAIFLGVTILTAIAVDIDSTESMIGRILFPISLPLERTLGHRGPIHSPFVAMAVYVILSLFQSWLAMPVLLGWMIGHLLPDLFNPAGLSLWPFPGRVSIPLFTPLGIFDRAFCIVLTAGICVFLAQKFVLILPMFSAIK